MNRSLPSTWRYAKLGKCCTVVSGATPRRNVPEYWGNDIPWVTPKDLSNLEGPILKDAPEYISKEGYRGCSTTILPKGSILFSSRAPIGLVSIAGRDMCTNQGFKNLIPGRDVDSGYLYNWIKWLAPKIADMGNGATFKEVSREIVSRVEIPLPSLPEQKRIAAILDKADAIRRKRQQTIKLADDFLRSVFLDMFGDPVTNPKGWDISLLKSFAIFENGDRSSRYPSGNEIKKEGILFINTRNILNNTLWLDKTQHITKEKFESLSRGKLKRGDLIITLRGTLGSCCIFDSDYENGFINAQLMIIRPKNICNNIFLHALLTSMPIKAKLQIIGQGAAVPQLTAKQLSELSLPFPPFEMQKQW